MGLCGAHIGAMLDTVESYCVMWGAYGDPWKSLDNGTKKNKQNYEGKKLCWQFFNHVEPYGAHVAAKLDHVVSCGELVGCHEGLCTARKKYQTKISFVGKFSWPLGGHARPCKARVGAMLGHVGSFGRLIGLHDVLCCAMWGSCWCHVGSCCVMWRA